MYVDGTHKHKIRQMIGEAKFSDCMKYRYWLSREWLVGHDIVTFVMLNPSTADASKSDPTVTRCIHYAEQWGFRKLFVLNIFAYRSPDPRDLYEGYNPDPVGPENKKYFSEILSETQKVICAWGTHGGYRDQQAKAYEWIKSSGLQPYAIKMTKDRFPAHPLYLKRDLIPFQIGEQNV